MLNSTILFIDIKLLAFEDYQQENIMAIKIYVGKFHHDCFEIYVHLVK